MNNKLLIVTDALDCIKRHGWCNIGKTHSDEIETIKNVITQCGGNCSTHEHEHSIQIFLNK